MDEAIHEFENGVKVYDRHLNPGQRERYTAHNVHEPDVEGLFVEVIRSLPPDGCFVDAGAAIGYYVLLARRLAPELSIYALEPLASHARMLADNVRLNGYAFDHFQIWDQAISEHDGEVEFVHDSYASSLVERTGVPERIRNLLTWAALKSLAGRILGFIGIARYRAGRKPTSRVTTITLATLLKMIGRPIDLLQMDIQGFEAVVLRGGHEALRSGSIRTFLIGTHGKSLHEACIRSLKAFGYSIEYDDPSPQFQSDGIVVASKGVQRLGSGAPLRYCSPQHR